ncbi:MAG: DUF86 domain-containing protein [Chloroflexota bacterium]|nr:DUF86 domain-containing protein [Chloroflexota bacterium]
MKDGKKLQDILVSVQMIENYSVTSFEEFPDDSKTQDAILYNLIIIGEAANQISEQLKEKYPEVPWSSMIGTRNIMFHGYDQVKLQIVWEILQHDLSALKSQIDSIVTGI